MTEPKQRGFIGNPSIDARIVKGKMNGNLKKKSNTKVSSKMTVDEQVDNNVITNDQMGKHFNVSRTDSKQSVTRRRLVVNFSGSMQDFYDDAKKTKWMISGDKSKIFQVPVKRKPGEKPTDEKIGDLTKIMLVDVSVKYRDGREMPAGVPVVFDLMQINEKNEVSKIIQGGVYNNDMDSFALTVYPGEQGRCNEHLIQLEYDAKTMALIDKYGAHSEESIRKQNMKHPGETSIYVGIKDLVGKIILENAPKLNIDTKKVQVHDGTWMKIEDSLFERVITQLKTIWPQLPLNDFRNFYVEMRRADGKEWNDLEGLISDDADNKAKQQILNRARRATIEIEIAYIIRDNKLLQNDDDDKKDKESS